MDVNIFPRFSSLGMVSLSVSLLVYFSVLCHSQHFCSISVCCLSVSLCKLLIKNTSVVLFADGTAENDKGCSGYDCGRN